MDHVVKLRSPRSRCYPLQKQNVSANKKYKTTCQNHLHVNVAANFPGNKGKKKKDYKRIHSATKNMT